MAAILVRAIGYGRLHATPCKRRPKAGKYWDHSVDRLTVQTIVTLFVKMGYDNSLSRMNLAAAAAGNELL
jgi:hypothetical protein